MESENKPTPLFGMAVVGEYDTIEQRAFTDKDNKRVEFQILRLHVKAPSGKYYADISCEKDAKLPTLIPGMQIMVPVRGYYSPGSKAYKLSLALEDFPILPAPDSEVPPII